MIHPTQTIRLEPNLAPDDPGLYALLLDRPHAIAAALTLAAPGIDVHQLGPRPILYIGATADSLRRRLTSHLRRDSRTSNLRMNLGALLRDELDLRAEPTPGQRYFDFGPAGEGRLTAWMDANLSVIMRACRYPAMHERPLIETQRPLLNVAYQPMAPLALQMKSLRRLCGAVRLPRRPEARP